jgi:hypothetical protein
MAKASKQDRVQTAAVQVAQATANARTAVQFASNISANEKKGMEIVRIRYELNVILSAFTDPQVEVALGLTMIGNNLPNYSISPQVINPAGVLHMKRYYSDELLGPLPAEARGQIYPSIEEVFDINPLLAHPASLYAFITSYDAAATLSGNIYVSYRIIDLTDEDYLDLFQGYMLQNTL